MSSGDDPQATGTVLVFIIGAILLLAVSVFGIVLFQNVQFYEDQRKLYAAKPQELAQLQAAQLAKINEYRYIDQDQGVVAIPIDEAIELYAAEMQGESPRINDTNETPDEVTRSTETP
jgi:hypothetical protein